jgi:multidrug resistance protein
VRFPGDGRSRERRSWTSYESAAKRAFVSLVQLEKRDGENYFAEVPAVPLLFLGRSPARYDQARSGLMMDIATEAETLPQTIPEALSEDRAANSGITPHRPLVFVAALSTIFMAAIEGTIVATAMPTIVGALGGIDLFSWIFGAYLLTQAILIPIYGRLADLYGRKPVLLFGIGVFLVGSVLCGLAWSMMSLIVFRILQGIGAGALIPVSQAVVADIYSGEARARVQGYISSTFGSAAIIGPMIGGVIATHISWRAVFWINVPLAIITAVLLIVALKENVQKRKHRIDYIGAGLMASATLIIMVALMHAETLSLGVLTLAFCAFDILIGALIFYESRITEPMIPVRLYRSRIIAAGNWVGVANGAITMAVIGFLPVYMQGLMGSSTIVSGLALGTISVLTPFGGFVGSRLVLRMPYRYSSTIGGVILVTGSVLLILLHPGANPLHPIIAVGLVGLGMGITNVSSVIALQANVDWTQRGAALSSVFFSRLIGQSFGSAVFGGIFNAGLANHGSFNGAEFVQLLQEGHQQIATIPGMQGVLDALAHSVHNIYLFSGLIGVLVLASALLFRSDLRLIERP